MLSPTLSRLARVALFSGCIAVLGCGGSNGPGPGPGPGTPAPTITSVGPASGSASGNTVVTIVGTGFVSGAGLRVTVGGAPATVVSATVDTILVKTAAHPAGPADVVVTNPDGQVATKAASFTYLAPLTLTSVTPATGLTWAVPPATAPAAVTITGTGFAAGAVVTFASSEASGVAVTGDTTITATPPPHGAGAVAVTVTNPDGEEKTLPAAFTFTNPPSGIPQASNLNLAPLTSGSAAGGDRVTLTGSGIQDGNVFFGGKAGLNPTITATRIDVTTPAHSAGPIDVTLVDIFGRAVTLAVPFTYVALPPTITSVNKAGGPPEGGTLLAIFGTNLSRATTVTFGGAAAQNVTFTPSPQPALIVTTPPKPAAAGEFVDVVVTNPGAPGVTAAITTPPLPGFHYGPPPAPTDFFIDGNPSSKTLNDGTAGQLIDIVGSLFSVDPAGTPVRRVQVLFTGISVDDGGTTGGVDGRSSPTTVVAAIPKLNAGTYRITVSNFDGQTAQVPGTLTIRGP
jgi:hypothetical protein